MADTGPVYVGTGADDATVGTLTWSSPGNITASDDVRASVAAINSVTETHYLMGTNLSLAVPDGATINGIVVEIERYYTSAK